MEGEPRARGRMVELSPTLWAVRGQNTKLPGALGLDSLFWKLWAFFWDYKSGITCRKFGMLLKRKPLPKQHGRECSDPSPWKTWVCVPLAHLWNRCVKIPRMMMWALKELTDPARAGYCSCEPLPRLTLRYISGKLILCMYSKAWPFFRAYKLLSALTHKYPVLLRIVNLC